MNHSDQINELATALAKAQGQIDGAKKDSANPFFKSTYADLASVWDACRRQLSSNGLSVTQCPEESENGISVETMMMHSSGQWISSRYSMPVSKVDAQAVGSAITYARRYALAAIVGIAPEDDDGNKAAKSKPDQPMKKSPENLPAYTDDKIDENVEAWLTAKLTSEKVINKISKEYILTDRQKDLIRSALDSDETKSEDIPQ